MRVRTVGDRGPSRASGGHGGPYRGLHSRLRALLCVRPCACCCLSCAGVDGCGGSGCGGAPVRERRSTWLALSHAASAAGSSRNVFRTIACSRCTALMPRSTVASKDAVVATGASLGRARPLIASSHAAMAACNASRKCAGISCCWNAPARGTVKRGTANFGWGWENPISNGISNAQKCAIPRRCTHIAYEPTRDIVGLSNPIERFLASTGQGNRR